MVENIISNPLHDAIATIAEKLDKELSKDNWLALANELLRRPPKDRSEIIGEDSPTLWVLKKWVQQDGKQATICSLGTALSGIYRNDLAEILLKFFEV